jgi:hypothetical protein
VHNAGLGERFAYWCCQRLEGDQEGGLETRDVRMCGGGTDKKSTCALIPIVRVRGSVPGGSFDLFISADILFRGAAYD